MKFLKILFVFLISTSFLYSKVKYLDFDDVSLQRNGLISGIKDGKYTYMDKNGSIVKLDTVKEKPKKIEEKIKEKIEVNYDERKDISEEVALLRIEGRWHFYNKKTKKLDNEEYDKVETLYANDVLLKVRQRGDFNVIDLRNFKKIIPLNFKYKQMLAKDFIKVSKNTELEPKKPSKQFGIVGVDGEVLADAVYDNIEGFDKNGFTLVKKDGKYGLMDKNGKEIVKTRYKKYVYSYEFEKYYLFLDKKWHIYDTNATEIGKGYEAAYFSLSGHRLLVKKGDKKVLISAKEPEKILATYNYDEVKRYECNCKADMVIVIDKGKYGLASLNGKELVKPSFDGIYSWTNQSARFKKGKKYGIMDFKGNVVLKPKYDRLEWTHSCDGLAMGYMGNKWQFIDIYSKPISKFYDASIAFSGQKNFAIHDRKTKLAGVLNAKGEEILPLKYKQVHIMQDGMFVVKNSKDETAFFDKNATMITPFSSGFFDYDMEKDMLLIKKYDKNRRVLLDWKIYKANSKEILFAKGGKK